MCHGNGNLLPKPELSGSNRSGMGGQKRRSQTVLIAVVLPQCYFALTMSLILASWHIWFRFSVFGVILKPLVVGFAVSGTSRSLRTRGLGVEKQFKKPP